MIEIENLLITTTTVITDSGKTHQWVLNTGWEIPGEKNIHTVSSYHPKGRKYLRTLTMEKSGERHVDPWIKTPITNNGAK